MTNTMKTRDGKRWMTAVEVLELFTFEDGIRLAWVTWIIGDGERRAISVRELER